jgi:hypothetical protein
VGYDQHSLLGEILSVTGSSAKLVVTSHLTNEEVEQMTHQDVES